MQIKMIFYIDGRRQPEGLFWNSLHGLASERQICDLLEGKEILIGGVKYAIEIVEED